MQFSTDTLTFDGLPLRVFFYTKLNFKLCSSIIPHPILSKTWYNNRMNKTKIIYILIALLIIAVGVGVFINSTKNKTGDLAREVISTSYSDGVSEVAAVFDNANDTVSFYHDSLGQITLERAISASGARFANADESIVFWEHQGEVTIIQDDETLFQGKIIPEPTANIDTDSSDGSMADLAANEWVWKETLLNDDTRTTPKSPDLFSLKFTTDGQVSGTTDCNNFFGSFTIEADKAITFGPLASTKKFCADSQETEFTDMITNSSHFIFDDSDNLILLLKFDSGSVVFEKKQ